MDFLFLIFWDKGDIYNPLILSMKNKNISFYIHKPPHRHTTYRIPFRRLIAKSASATETSRRAKSLIRHISLIVYRGNLFSTYSIAPLSTSFRIASMKSLASISITERCVSFVYSYLISLIFTNPQYFDSI